MRSIEEVIKIHIPCIPLIVQANHIGMHAFWVFIKMLCICIHVQNVKTD